MYVPVGRPVVPEFIVKVVALPFVYTIVAPLNKAAVAFAGVNDTYVVVGYVVL